MRRVPCIGHLLHNAISKGLESDEIRELIVHCRKIVSLFHSSQPYRTKLRKVMKDLNMPDKQLVNDVSTRWGSKYKMLHRVKELMAATNQVLMDDRRYRDLSLNWQQASLIDAVLKCLDGFHTLTDLLSGEKDVTISSAIPMLRHIGRLVDTEGDVDESVKEVLTVIKTYLQEKLQDPELLLFLRVAETLDPRYQELSSDDTVSFWLDLPTPGEVKAYILEHALEVVCDEETTTIPKSPPSEPTGKKRKSLASLLMSTHSAASNVTASPNVEVTRMDKLKRELDFYTQLKAPIDLDVLKWWRNHQRELPLLSEYARYILSSCASSVPSERLFSISGHIVSKRRNALKPNLVDQLVFLAMNKDMLA